MALENTLVLSDYQALAELRHQIRRFLHFSEQAARFLVTDEELATTFDVNPLMAGSTTRTRETAIGIYHLPKDVGSIGASYDAMNQTDSFQDSSPGLFIYGETRAFPLYLGAFNDGFADGLTSDIVRKTREFRLWYSQTAFESPRVKGTWGVGYRQVSHSRNVGITYLAIVPNLPPVIPPVLPPGASPLDYQPLPDFVSQTANYSGHGLGASLDLEFPLHPRVSIITGLSVGLIRGSAKSEYLSASSYYFQDGNPDVLTTDQLFTILSSGSTTEIATVHQAYFVKALDQPAVSQFAETLDIYLGLDVRLYKGLKIFLTLRDTYYANVGSYVVPQYDFSNETTPLSAGYEGYVLGLSWRF
jgi:hypothetical protein